MAGFLLRILITAAGLWLAAEIVGGMYIADTKTLILAALLLGIVNAVVRPLALVVTLPLTFLTLGLFILVVNAGMLGLVALLLPGFAIEGFFSALFGAIIVSIVSWFASSYVGPKGRIEVIVRRR